MKYLVDLIRQTYSNWRNDRTLRLGAGLAYYAIFSLVPLMAISVYFASILFPEEEVVRFLQEQAVDLLGASSSQVVEYLSQQSVMTSIQDSFNSLGLFGIAALVVTASFAIIALLDSINIIWGRPVTKGIENTVRRYAFSYVTVLTASLLLLLIMTVRTVISTFEEALNIDGTVVDLLTSTLTQVITWAMMILALGWLMRVLTQKRVSWKHALIGSGVTFLFMYIGVELIGLYLNTFSYRSVTSAFSAVLFVLVWVYYESQILLAGFQLTKTLSNQKKR